MFIEYLTQAFCYMFNYFASITHNLELFAWRKTRNDT